MREAFPDSIRKSDHTTASGGVIKNYNDANIDKGRFSSPIRLDNDTEIAVSTQFVPATFEIFVNVSKNLGYDITPVDSE